MEFYKYLKRELGFSVSAIGYLEKKYGDEPSDIVISRIMQLLDALREAGLDVKYINQCNSILDIIDIYDEDEFIDRIKYIKKLNKKRSPYMNVNIIVARANTNSSDSKEFDKIIELLEREGLSDILQDRSLSNSKILYSTTYIQIYNNLNILRQIKNYKSLIRSNVQVLFKMTPEELQRMVKEIKEKEVNDRKDYKNNSNDDLYNYENNGNEEIEFNDKIEENNNEEQIINKSEEKPKEIFLGSEDRLSYILGILKENSIPYTIILSCPEILKRKNLKQLNDIIKLLKKNNISLSILEQCPQILQRGNYNTILNIIEELKLQGLSLNILMICPSILVVSNSKKINKIVEILKDNNISKYLIYSCPQILISGDTKVLVKINNELKNNYIDIDLILDIAPYTFVEKVYNSSVENNEDSEYVKKTNLFSFGSITVIKNIDEVQKVINILKENNISVDILKDNTEIVNKLSVKQAKDIIQEVNNQGFESNIFRSDPKMLAFSNVLLIREVTSSIREHNPNKYKKIINAQPNLYYKSSRKKIDNIYKIFENNNLDKKIIEENPEILIREDEQEVDKIFKILTKKGFTKKVIEERARILVDGKSEYIDDNIILFERNNIKMPLNILYVKSTENIEKNIDILIENNLYRYIELCPQILNFSNSQLQMYIEIAKRKSIDILKKDRSGNVSFNMKYFDMDAKELCEKYNLNYDAFNDFEKSIESKKKKKIKNPELYKSVYSIFQDRIKDVLKEYNEEGVSYCKNDRIISEQRIIRETYIDLEENVSNNGKKVLKNIDLPMLLRKKFDTLTNSSKEQIRKMTNSRQKENNVRSKINN